MKNKALTCATQRSSTAFLLLATKISRLLAKRLVITKHVRPQQQAEQQNKNWNGFYGHTGMAQNKHLPGGYYFTATLCCVAAYCVPVAFLFGNDSFTNLWLPYIGNGLYAIMVFAAVVYYNDRKAGNASLLSMVTSSLKLLAITIITICVVLLFMLLAFKPGVMTHAPANNVRDNNNGLTTILYINAVLVNFLAGSFAAFIASVTAKRGQEDATGADTPYPDKTN